MPGERWHGDEIERLDGEHLVADQRFAVASQDHHRVHMLVSLERRIAGRRDFEVAELPAQVRPAKQRLPGHVAKRGASFFFVARDFDAIPAVIAVSRHERTDWTLAHPLPAFARTASTNS